MFFLKTLRSGSRMKLELGRGVRLPVFGQDKGHAPRLIRQQQFEYAYIFGAVCPMKDPAVGLVMPTIGMDCMQYHLENLSLLPLPVASSELSPTEQVWQVLRDRYLANRCFESYDHVVKSCCDAWDAFTSRKGAIRQLCSRDWVKTKDYF